MAGDKTDAADLFDTCTRFDIRSFVEDELARIKLKEWAGKPESSLSEPKRTLRRLVAIDAGTNRTNRTYRSYRSYSGAPSLTAPA